VYELPDPVVFLWPSGSGVLAHASDPCAVEFCEREPVKCLVPTLGHVLQHRYGDGLAQNNGIYVVVASMDGSMVPAYGDVCGYFVHLSGYGELVAIDSIVRQFWTVMLSFFSHASSRLS
jgi:hypothetical protein